MNLAACLEQLEELIGVCSGEIGDSLSQCLTKVRNYLKEQQVQSDTVAKAQADAIVNSALMMVQLEEAQAKLVLAQKESDELRVAAERANAAKSAFLASMSHEIRTPLNAIIGYSEFLQENAAAAGHDDYIPDLKRIQSAGQHMLALISDILDLSKIEAGMMQLLPEEFDVPALLAELVETMTPFIERNKNSFIVEIPKYLGLMFADKLRVRQILFNLLNNAGKFTRNSQVSFSANRQITPAGECIIFNVRDGGIGIASEFVGCLFKDFIQGDSSTTRKYGGTGLGLAICKKLCDTMGGEITVQSELGKGSLFTVRLPVKWSENSCFCNEE